MDSWDDDEYEVPVVAAPKPVVASWEDEEEEEEDENIQEQSNTNDKNSSGALKPKQLKKQKMKELEEKRRMEIEITKARLAEQANETPAERKAREKKQMEEADFQHVLDGFATTSVESTEPSASSGSPGVPKASGPADLETTIMQLQLKTSADHENFGDIIANKLNGCNAKFALECMKVILTKASINLTADDVKDLNTILNVIKNEKIAAAKPKGKKKKVTGRQGYANVERGGGNRRGAGVYDDDYNDYDEYDDFM